MKWDNSVKAICNRRWLHTTSPNRKCVGWNGPQMDDCLDQVGMIIKWTYGRGAAPHLSTHSLSTRQQSRLVYDKIDLIILEFLCALLCLDILYYYIFCTIFFLSWSRQWHGVHGRTTCWQLEVALLTEPSDSGTVPLEYVSKIPLLILRSAWSSLSLESQYCFLWYCIFL